MTVVRGEGVIVARTHKVQVFECLNQRLLFQLWVSDQELTEWTVDSLHQREEGGGRWSGHCSSEIVWLCVCVCV